MKRTPWPLRGTILLVSFAALYGLRIGEPSWGGSEPPAYAPSAESSGTRIDATPPRYLFDERYTAFSAHRLALGDDKVFEPGVRRYRYLADAPSDLGLFSRGEWSHPPGAPLLMSLAVRLFGFSAASVRVVSLLASLATLLGVAAMTARRWRLPCALLALDGVFFLFARTAMPHMLVAAAVTAGAALLHRAALSRRRLELVVGAGAFFGFGASVRWTAVPIALAVVLAVCLSRRRRGALTMGMAVGACLAALATYLLTFLPYFLHGHGLAALLTLHEKMLWFHRHLRAPSGQVTAWYAWPFGIKAIFFNARATSDRVAMVLCTGTRTLWWALVPVLALAVRRWVRTRSMRDAIAASAIAGTWLPWAVLSRAGLFYYLLPALPFCAVLIARELRKLGRRRPWVPPAYLVLAGLNFALLYPVLASVPLRGAALEAYRAVLLHGTPTPARAQPPSLGPDAQ